MKRLILVVEDDMDTRESLRDLLDIAGYDVSMASNGKEALERLTSIEPCLILLDLMMPIMSGPEFLDVRCENDRIARIPVVIVSAWPKEAERATTVQGFIKKPIDLDTLTSVINEYCSSESPGC
jgi:CheY-like chemotaxis protein